MFCSYSSKLKCFFPISKDFIRVFSGKSRRVYHVCNLKCPVQLSSKHITFAKFLGNSYSKVANSQTSDIDQDLNEFNDAYETIKKSLLYVDDKAITDALNWSSKVLDYNVQGGKKNRGVTVLKAYKILAQENLTSNGKLHACVLGWCVEMLQAFLLILDDIMDHSVTRRGKPCWYQQDDVGLVAINDGILLEHGIYKILEMHFGKSKAYSSILQEFLKVTRKTVYGQTLDMLNVPPNKKPKYENFDLERYNVMVEYKTSHYTFCLPVHLAMHLNGNFCDKDFDSTRNICLKLGLLFQIQDDYLDVYGDPKVTGKVGTDIIDGKCSWFAAYVFENGTNAMKHTMVENYGINSPDCVSKVLKVYEDMNMVQKFHSLEENLEKEIESLMNHSLSCTSLKDLFRFLLQKVHKRKK